MDAIDRIAAETRFSGVVRVDVGDEVVFAGAYGLANRGCAVPNTQGSQLAIASGVKGLTALTVVSLIEEGLLALATTARSVLGADLPLIADDVTIEQLLAHRSGIGDYLDEEADFEVDDYMMPVAVHELRTTEQYLRVLDGHPQKFAPGERFSYCNGGFVVLALIAERVTGTPFPELVEQRVCAPAGMRSTEFLQSDELPGAPPSAIWRSTARRPTCSISRCGGAGTAGIYTTTADVHAMWNAIFSGRVVPEHWVTEMIRPRSDDPSQSMRYGLGFWLHESRDIVMLKGYDAGVSFRTVHDPGRRITHTVISNTSEGAWPITRYLDEQLGT